MNLEKGMRSRMEGRNCKPVMVSLNSMRRSPTSARSETVFGVKFSSTSMPREIDYEGGEMIRWRDLLSPQDLN